MEEELRIQGVSYDVGVDATQWKPKELTSGDQSMKDGAAQV